MILAHVLLPIADITLSDEVGTIEVSSLTLDSRQVTPGALFFAINGACVNGAAFIDDAITQGAVAVLVQGQTLSVDTRVHRERSIPVITVVYLNRFVSEIASHFYSHPSLGMPIIGITGTNGKTTCSYLYAQLAQPCAMLGTLGYGVIGEGKTNLTETGLTTPDAIRTQAIIRELKDSHASQLVMEVSSHALDQFRVLGVDINTAIFTNLTHDHLDYHGTLENYQAAKARLFQYMSVAKAVINYDDAFGKILAHKSTKKQSLITYSLSNPQADFYLSQLSYHSSGSQATLHSPFGDHVIKSPLLGEFNWYNLLAVLATCITSSAELSKIAQAVTTLEPVVGRMEVVSTSPVPVVIDYAHTPDALKNALNALRLHFDQQIICVFGCGGARDRSKRSLMGSVAVQHADQVIVTSDNPRNEMPEDIINDITYGLTGNISIEVDRAIAIEQAITLANPGDIVLIAGKGHEQFQWVNDRKIPFSDHQCAIQALDNRRCVS